MDLATYISNVQLLLNDPNAQFYTTASLTNYINRARVYVAGRTQCCRLLTPSSGPISTVVTVTAGGSGYTTAPTVTVSAPDALGPLTYTQATATATVVANAVTAVTVTNAGTGYVNPPTFSFSGGGGSGATATGAATTGFLSTTANQEVYPFSAVNTILQSAQTGADKILGVASVSIAIGSTKPTLNWCDFLTFQAYARAANWGQNQPSLWSQYAQGETGSIYLWPVPSQKYQMEWDCFVAPLALSALQLVDIIPEPWSEPVTYYAAYLAYLNAQRKDDANFMRSECERLMLETRGFVTPVRIPTMYPTE
jgi:hypothetical protein